MEKHKRFLFLNSDSDGTLIIESSQFNKKIILPASDSYCLYCKTALTETRKHIILGCGHRFCKDCMEVHRKKLKNNEYVCFKCQMNSENAFITDENSNIKYAMILKEKFGHNKNKIHLCKKCKEDIKTKPHVVCMCCDDSYYHTKCLLHFNNEIMGEIFVCPKCLDEKFIDESYDCETCNEYSTRFKPNLIRHKKKCQKYVCFHCGKNYKGKVFLKEHHKKLQKEEKRILLLGAKNN